MGKSKVRVSAGFDRQLIHCQGDSVRYLVAEVTAPARERETNHERKPLNVAVVLDASGSMRGPRIDAALQAATGVVESLAEGNTLSIISFDSDSNVRLRGVGISGETRKQAVETVRQIRAGSMTNLSAGWLDGAECVAEVMESSPGQVNRVLVLSDGHANQGVLDPAELTRIADGLRERGILTSTVGIGDDYSTVQIQAIAEHGGGLMHDAERPEEIVEVVMGEFGDILRTYAEDTHLHILHDPQVRVECVGQFPLTSDEGCTVCKLGSLLSERTRSVVLKLTVPPGNSGEHLRLELSLRLKIAGQEEVEKVSIDPLELSYARGGDNANQSRDVARSLLVAQRWQAYAIQRSIQLNREHRYAEARDYLLKELKFFRPYCEGLPGAEHFAGELELAARRFERPMGERMRKNMAQDIYTGLKGKQDYRRHVRPGWKAMLVDNDKEQGGCERYPLRMENGHPVADIHGVRVLVDTGSPVSLGSVRELGLCGRVHQLSRGVLGLRIEHICRDANLNVHVLLGNDIMGQYCVALDVRRGELLVSTEALPASGHPVSFALINGIPMVSVGVESRMVSVFLDSGAFLSYLSPSITGGRTSDGEAEDFYPGICRFTTPTYRIATEVNGSTHLYRYGILPGLLESMVSIAGAEGILGNELCRDYRVTLDYVHRRLWLDAY